MEGYQAHPVLLEDGVVGFDQVGDVLTIMCKAKILVWQLDISFHYYWNANVVSTEPNSLRTMPSQMSKFTNWILKELIQLHTNWTKEQCTMGSRTLFSIFAFVRLKHIYQTPNY